jgi:hypothetical protein
MTVLPSILYCPSVVAEDDATMMPLSCRRSQAIEDRNRLFVEQQEEL